MLKKLLILVLCTNLTGCMWQDLNNTEIRKALHFCKSTENIEWVSAWALGGGSVRCVDGKYDLLNKITIEAETK